LEKERNDLIEQGVIKIDENNKISEDDTIDMQIEVNKEENNAKKVPTASGPKKNLNFLAELNNKLAKPNLKRKASEAELPKKESSDIELNNTEEDPTGVENNNKRRKIAK
jgi:RecA-family ATPase